MKKIEEGKKFAVIDLHPIEMEKREERIQNKARKIKIISEMNDLNGSRVSIY